MKTSVILTTHDREMELLLACLRSLRLALGDDQELIVVDDRSTSDVSWLEPYLERSFAHATLVRTGKYDGYRIGGEAGYGNPARAFNRGLDYSTGERILCMSSDVSAPRRTFSAAMRSDGLWCCRVMDLETQSEYCGPSRVFPMPWLIAFPRHTAVEVGGWDERYLGGLCYEDNDFVGRLALALGGFFGDWQCMAYHHSHVQPAYEVEVEEVARANQRNRRLTLDKWGTGIPFGGAGREGTAFDVIPEPHPSGLRFHRTRAEPGLLERVVASTEREVMERA